MSFLKKIIATQLLLLSFFSFAQSTTPEKHNYALLVSQPRHVTGILKMLEKMRTDPKALKYENARVVLYGDAIHTAKKGSDITDMIAEAKKHKVTVAVCNQAMKRLEVSPKELLPTVEVVENAYYEMLRLKTLGYISLDL